MTSSKCLIYYIYKWESSDLNLHSSYKITGTKFVSFGDIFSYTLVFSSIIALLLEHRQSIDFASGRVCRYNWCCCCCYYEDIELYQCRVDSTADPNFAETSCRMRHRDYRNYCHRARYRNCKCCRRNELDSLEDERELTFISLILNFMTYIFTYHQARMECLDLKVFQNCRL